jgi:hypothetical protein
MSRSESVRIDALRRRPLPSAPPGWSAKIDIAGRSAILRGKLCIGIHRDVDATGEKRPLVSQAFCSALPVAYTHVPPSHWEVFASLILQAAYEATMLAALLNAQRGASNVVLLTQLGGGAFGNRDDWIHAAMRRALEMMREVDLEARLVSYGKPSRTIVQMASLF